MVAREFGFIKRFYLISEDSFFLLVQKLRDSLSNPLVTTEDRVMHHQKDDDKFVSSLNQFFSVLKLTDEFEIISMNLIINKCVLIEKNDLFFTSTSSKP